MMNSVVRGLPGSRGNRGAVLDLVEAHVEAEGHMLLDEPARAPAVVDRQKRLDVGFARLIPDRVDRPDRSADTAAQITPAVARSEIERQLGRRGDEPLLRRTQARRRVGWCTVARAIITSPPRPRQRPPVAGRNAHPPGRRGRRPGNSAGLSEWLSASCCESVGNPGIDMCTSTTNGPIRGGGSCASTRNAIAVMRKMQVPRCRM